jgi:hypothetical protein
MATPSHAHTSNRHIVDRLADVRAKIKQLQDDEKELKEEVGRQMGAADSLGGDEFIASQSITERKGSIDEAKVAKKLGVENLDAFRKSPSTVVTIRVERRAAEEAA